MGGISLGGIIVIIGIVVAILWSLWLGIVIALIGLIAFGGFARGGGTERHFSSDSWTSLPYPEILRAR